MEHLSRWILSVIAASFVVAIVCALVDKKGSAGVLLRLLGGLFLTFTLISPLVELDFAGILDHLEAYTETGQLAAVQGEALAREEYRTIIKDKLEAYILDKAEALGLTVAPEITLDEQGMPQEVILRGAATPGGKTRLQQIIQEDLGISKENQLWIG